MFTQAKPTFMKNGFHNYVYFARLINKLASFGLDLELIRSHIYKQEYEPWEKRTGIKWT